jgi:hypothetical protein
LPFTTKTLVFLSISAASFFTLPFVTRWFFERNGGRVSELETKYLLFTLFGLGGIAVWSGSEAVLPAYIIGMVLAGTVGTDHLLIRRLRTLTFGMLTPFYFTRTGSFVSVPVLIAAPLVSVAFVLCQDGLQGSLACCRPYWPLDTSRSDLCTRLFRSSERESHDRRPDRGIAGIRADPQLHRAAGIGVQDEGYSGAILTRPGLTS